MSRTRIRQRPAPPAAVAPRPAIQATDLGPYRGGYGTGLVPNSEDSGTRGWRPKLDRDAARMVSQYQQRAMLSDARFIFSRVGQVSGAIREKRAYAVGKAWVPQYLGNDAKYKAAFNQRIQRSWLGNADLRGRPYDFQCDVGIGSLALDRDGDFFILLTESENGSPRLQLIESHRIGSPGGQNLVTEGNYKGRKMLNGIVYDEFDRPLAYNLLPADAGYGVIPYGTAYNFLPASAVQHVYDPQYFSQGRGVPTICHGILDWYDMHEMREAEKTGVKAFSKHAMVEYNDTGRADLSAAYTANRTIGGTADASKVDTSVKVIEDGLIRYFRAGSGNKIESLEGNRPGAAWESFMDHIARSAHRGMDWPIEMHDLRGIGGASVRGLVSQVKRSVEQRQEQLWSPFRAAVLYAAARYMARGELPMADDWDNIGFSLPATFGVDVGRDQENRRLNIAMGLETVASYVTESGEGDLEDHFRANARASALAQRIAEEEGVDIERVYNPGAASQPAAATLADDPAETPAAPADAPPR
jgi:capsid protein